VTAWLTFQAVACCGRRIPPYAGQDAIELTSLRVCHATIRCGTIIRLSFLQFASNCCSQQEASDVGQGGLPCWHDERASVDTLITLWYEFGQLQFSFSMACPGCALTSQQIANDSACCLSPDATFRSLQVQSLQVPGGLGAA